MFLRRSLSASSPWSLLLQQSRSRCLSTSASLRKAAATPNAEKASKHHGHDDHHHHDEQEGPERHEVLGPFFYKFWGAVWVLTMGMVAQHKYFTRPDENGNARLHPITRWILWHRRSEAEKHAELLALLTEAHQEGEADVFYAAELHRPVKDPRFDKRILHQKDWVAPPDAQDTDHVDLSDLKWRKGYGEDEDGVEALQAKEITEKK